MPLFPCGSADVVASVKWGEFKCGNRKIKHLPQWATNHPSLSSLQKGSHAFNCKYWENWVPYQLWYLQLRRAQPAYHRSHTISESHSSAGSNGSWTERNCPWDQHQWFDPRIEKRNETNKLHLVTITPHPSRGTSMPRKYFFGSSIWLLDIRTSCKAPEYSI